ncbi:MAG: response regulator transcription factor [Gammaproteobacteria bacterium]|nr:response regulator transcription factor [Gammaproteobacteria bacterium]
MNQDKPLLLVDDDATFRGVLARSLTKRGFSVTQADSAAAAGSMMEQQRPACAVVDLSMPGESGLRLIQPLLALNPQMRIVVLTGYASIATAVEAMKLGAIHYLTKPADADEIIAAFDQDKGDEAVAVAEQPIPLNRVEWEHIQRVLNECDGNISETARRLGMHRRTLQRKLQKRPSKS